MLSSKLHSSIGNTDRLYVDDVFSAYTYTGNGSTQTINNGIDLAGKGGLVWTKALSAAHMHWLHDTVMGVNKPLTSYSTAAQNNLAPYGVTSFNSNGFSVNDQSAFEINVNGINYASWTFRKAPKFFDVVTYTGNGASNRVIAHSLGQEVGMVMTKATSTTGDWNTYHRSATGDLVLNTTAAQTGSKALVNFATTSTFTVSGAANTNAVTYVAYLFAHDTSADGIIQCGSYVGNEQNNTNAINLGFEPQYLIVKKATSTGGNWFLVDNMRGLTSGASSADKVLYANVASAESEIAGFSPTATGFIVKGGSPVINGAGESFIYLAIRRPNKPPTTGTEVYNAIARTGNDGTATFTGVGFAPDLSLTKSRTEGARHTHLFDRLRGASKKLSTGDVAGESLINGVTSFGMDGVTVGTDSDLNASSQNYINHFFRRAPGFFDVVCYTGTGAARTVPHSLGVAPELMIVKSRSASEGWYVYHAALGSGGAVQLNNNGSAYTGQPFWNSTQPTASAFSVGGMSGVGNNGATFVWYGFSTLPGISKVGSYTGNGTTQTINCGFTTGVRFFLVKATSTTGSWWVFDSVRGVIAATDPVLQLNSTAAEITSADAVDPNASGIIVNQEATCSINANGVSYVYLAIA